MKRALTALAAVAVAGAGVLTAASPGVAAAPSAPKPTVVLVHGAFEDASAWAPVTRRLLAEHYPVVAPAVPLRGIAADVASLQGVLDAVKGPKILVGHSYGGLLISELAGRTADVRALVCAAAFIPEAGETAGQLNAQFPGSLIGPRRSPPPRRRVSGSTLSSPPATRRFPRRRNGSRPGARTRPSRRSTRRTRSPRPHPAPWSTSSTARRAEKGARSPGPFLHIRAASTIAWANGRGASCGTLWPMPSNTRCSYLPVNLAR